MIDSFIATLKTILKVSPMLQLILYIVTGFYLTLSGFQNPPILIGDILSIPMAPKDINKLWLLNVSCIIIFVITFFITFYNVWSHNFIKKIKSQEFKELYNGFHSENMAQKIKKIYDWKIKNPEQGEYTKQLRLIESNPDFDKIHSTRRYISQYYRKIWEDYEIRHIITLNEVKELVTKDRVKILLNIIEPFEMEIGEDYDKTIFNFFKNI